MIDKVIRDGKVAVLYSPGFGSGWYSWSYNEEWLYDPHLVSLVENHDLNVDDDAYEEAKKYCEEKWPDKWIGGLPNLSIEWVPVCSFFKIREYDGSEHVEVFNNGEGWLMA